MDKTKQIALPDRWVRALLEVPMGGDDTGSLGEALERAQNSLKSVVERARVFLVQSPLTTLVAQAAAQEQGLGGTAKVTMDALGNVLLDTAGCKRKSGLPTLEELRARARAAGIDVSACGRSRNKILKVLAAPKPAPAPAPKKMVKTAPAIGPAVHVSYPDETDLSPDLLEAKEPPVSSPLPAPGKKSKLRLAEADVVGIDLNAILKNESEH